MLGWEVFAFDISEEGRKKAFKLAEKNKVKIDYQLGDLLTLTYEKRFFDAIGIIYAHFSPILKSIYFSILNELLRKEAIVIIEVFSKNHIAYIQKNEKVGCPRDIHMLYSIEEIKSYFSKCEIQICEEKEILLLEGLYHDGEGMVIQFVGKVLD